MDEVAAVDRFALYREVVTERFYAPRLPPPPSERNPRPDEVIDLPWLVAELAAIERRRAVLVEGDDGWYRERDSMGLFTSKPADSGDDKAREDTEPATKKLFRRMGKVASDHNARVTDSDEWPNHDKRGRGSR